MTDVKQERPLIITGLSGAGISSVLKALEDFKFEVFDNFPLPFIPQLLPHSTTTETDAHNGIAIGVDVRARGFSPSAVLQMVRQIDARLLYITCDDNVLFKRFTETRRSHPLARNKSVSFGIKAERELLEPLRTQADIVIDTTDTSIHDLRHMLEGHLSVNKDEHLTISLLSFGFKNGIPRSADIVMDVRFLKNPHWQPDLKPKTGQDTEVGEYIRQDPDFNQFLEGFKSMLAPLLPRYAQEGKSYLTVAIGCTGGKHRSVYTVETLKSWLDEQGLNSYIEHRDMPTTS
ncbi:MAG: RNase adapter RapZ [Alphaproteobacteria bacterium]